MKYLTTEDNTIKPESINWHIYMNCNLHCKFCFKTFDGFKKSLPQMSPYNVRMPDAKIILEKLHFAGFKKITFAGGEPTLHLLLPEIMSYAKELGFKVGIVTNGHFLTDHYLEKIKGNVDYIKISIDSSNEEIQAKLGRGEGDHVRVVKEAGLRVKSFGISLMLNTVVTSLNYSDNLSDILNLLKPVRWKVFQALPEKGENDKFDWWSTDKQFQQYIERHENFSPIAESNDLMRNSYVIMDPIGRFMQDSTGEYVYSKSILSGDVLDALHQVGWDPDIFLKRGGI